MSNRCIFVLEALCRFLNCYKCYLNQSNYAYCAENQTSDGKNVGYGIFHLLWDRKNAYIFAKKSDLGDTFSYFQGGGGFNGTCNHVIVKCLSELKVYLWLLSMELWNKFEWRLSVTKAQSRVGMLVCSICT